MCLFLVFSLCMNIINTLMLSLNATVWFHLHFEIYITVIILYVCLFSALYNMSRYFFNLFFYWRIVFYRSLLFSVKPQHESALGIHISSPFWTSLLFSTPSHPSRLIQIKYYLFYTWQCKFPCYSFHTSHPLLPSPHVHKSILYVCFSIAALKINSSVLFF